MAKLAVRGGADCAAIGPLFWAGRAAGWACGQPLARHRADFTTFDVAFLVQSSLAGPDQCSHVRNMTRREDKGGRDRGGVIYGFVRKSCGS